MEKWKPIPEVPGFYISNHGRIKSRVNNIRKPYKTKDGYQIVPHIGQGLTSCFTVNRLVANAFVPNPNNLKYVKSKDSDRYNLRADNLYWSRSTH